MENLKLKWGDTMKSNTTLPAMTDAQYSLVIKGTHPSIGECDAQVIRGLNHAISTVMAMQRDDDPKEVREAVEAAASILYALQLHSPLKDSMLSLPDGNWEPLYNDGDVVADIFAGR